MNPYAFSARLKEDYMEQSQSLSQSLSLSQQQFYNVWELVIPHAITISDTNKDSFSSQVRIAELCRVCKLFNRIIIVHNWFDREIWQEYIEKYELLKIEVMITWKNRFRYMFKSSMDMDDLNIQLETLNLKPNRKGELLVVKQKIEKNCRARNCSEKIMDLLVVK